MKFEELETLVVEWGENKGIIPKSTPTIQLGKTLEELGELLLGLQNNNDGEIIDAFGDVLVTLILSHTLYQNKSIVDCLEHSYNIISKRTGKMINGQFVKDE